MRISIRHETAYTYAVPASRAIEVLRLSPRGHDGQFVLDWRIDVDRDCRLDQSSDPFGNTVHTFTAEGPLEGLTIVAEGQIETSDTNGIVTGQIERFPAQVFLRDTTLTTANAAICEFADGIATRTAGGAPLEVMHALMAAIRERLRFDVDATDTGTSAIEAFGIGHGVCQDFAHIFIAAVRHLGIPARYVSGYLCRRDYIQQEAGHAWAEALIPDLGWVGFDPANGISPTDAYVRAAIGLDYLGAAPIRGVRYGGRGESLAVHVHVADITRGR
ncbi:MAG TPA: transglutaminase family protein [Bauldia sp.]|nr:transglutaminase family protein [Bauldia sp.]